MEASNFSGLTCMDHPSFQEPPHHSFLLQLSQQPNSQPSPALKREHNSTDQFLNMILATFIPPATSRPCLTNYLKEFNSLLIMTDFINPPST